VSVEAIVEAREAYHAMRCESLDTPHRNGDNEGASLLDTIAGPDGDFARVRDRVTIETLLEALEDRERLVVQLYYQHNLTQAEIGERLGCSQMQISRILRTALQQLAYLARRPRPAASAGEGSRPRSTASRSHRPISNARPIHDGAFAQARHGALRWRHQPGRTGHSAEPHHADQSGLIEDR